LGVLGQLIRDAPLVAEERGRALELLEEGARTVAAPTFRPDALQQVGAQVVHALCAVLLELSERCPLIIVVDDVHHADRAALLCFAYLARRVRTARIALLFSQSDQGRYTDAFFQNELLRQPHCRRIPLTPLSPQGVAALAA